MSYCEAADIKESLDIDGYENTVWLDSLSVSASAWIDAYCGLPTGGFAVAADTTRTFDVRSLRGGALLLDVPCLAVTTLLNADGTALPANGFRLYPLNEPRKWRIELLGGYGWALVDDGLYTVTGRWGWSAGAPAPVREAAVMLTGWMFKRYQAALQDNAAVPELGQILYGEAMPKQVMALLSPFRNGTVML